MRMLARGVADLKLASEKPLLVLWMGFQISWLGLLSGFRTANGPWPFRKANRGANSQANIGP